MIADWVKRSLAGESAGETFTRGKWKAGPQVIFWLTLPVVVLNFHLLGFVPGFVMACIYILIFRLDLLFLHYSDDEDYKLSLGMGIIEIALLFCMGLNCFGMIIAEASHGSAVIADKKYEAALEKYQRYVVQRQAEARADAAAREEMAQAAEKARVELEGRRAETAATVAQAQAQQSRYQARIGDQMLIAQRKGLRLPAPLSAPQPAGTPEAAPTVTPIPEPLFRVPVVAELTAPVAPKWTQEECLVWWQGVIKAGQFVEFLITVVGGLGWLRYRSNKKNHQYRQSLVRMRQGDADRPILTILATQNTGQGKVAEIEPVPFPVKQVSGDPISYPRPYNGLQIAGKYDLINKNEEKPDKIIPRYDVLEQTEPHPAKTENERVSDPVEVAKTVGPPLPKSRQRIEEPIEWLGKGYFVTRDGRQRGRGLNLNRRVAGQTSKSGLLLCPVTEAELKQLQGMTRSQQVDYLVRRVKAKNRIELVRMEVD